MVEVPLSRFRRELNKWSRYVNRTGNYVVVTHRNKPSIVFIGVKQYEEIMSGIHKQR